MRCIRAQGNALTESGTTSDAMDVVASAAAADAAPSPLSCCDSHGLEHRIGISGTYFFNIITRNIPNPPLLRLTRDKEPVIILAINVQYLVLFHSQLCWLFGLIVV